MPTYAWRWRSCGEEVVTDPKLWLVLESLHRLLHRLEDHVDVLGQLLTPTRTAELTREVGT
jgi:hypothetical protein